MCQLYRSTDRACRLAAILLSRQALRPCGKTAWVKQSIEAVQWLKEQNLALCTSLGMQTWELITSLGSINDLDLEIHIPCKDRDDFRILATEACVQFNLNKLTTRFLPVFNHDEDITIRHKRDREVVGRADLLLPVSIRPGGYMDSLLEEFEDKGKTINRDFATGYKARALPVAYELDLDRVNLAMRQLEDSYLIHWTRTCNCAWPGERLIDYYRAVIDSESYPRSAYDTLKNIVTTKTIKASSRNMPGKTPTVSFSNCPPAVMVKLMTWRARYRMMSFEPYGIGIDKITAQSLNILPVNYYDRNGETGIDSRHWLSQSRGEKSDWTVEDEYRHLGDMDLSGIDDDKLMLVCRTAIEADELTACTGLKTIPFTTDRD